MLNISILDYWKEHHYIRDYDDILVQKDGKLYKAKYKLISSSDYLFHSIVVVADEDAEVNPKQYVKGCIEDDDWHTK